MDRKYILELLVILLLLVCSTAFAQRTITPQTTKLQKNRARETYRGALEHMQRNNIKAIAEARAKFVPLQCGRIALAVCNATLVMQPKSEMVAATERRNAKREAYLARRKAELEARKAKARNRK